MAEALILDAEAVNALARPGERGALAGRARAIVTVSLDRRALLRVPVAVLCELCRGTAFDAPVNRFLKESGVAICDLTPPIARRAGALLARAKLSSAHAVDAFVVATALEFERAVIATADPTDIKRLAAPYRQVRILTL